MTKRAAGHGLSNRAAPAPATIETACAATSVMIAATRGSVAYRRIRTGELTVHSRHGRPAAADRRSTPSGASR